MYSSLLSLHSLLRWLVLLSLVYAIFLGYRGWFGKKTFSRHDNFTRHTTATIAQLQMVLGLWIYFISPLMDSFMHHYKEAVKQGEIRFFGMEHSVMMAIAVVLITIGSMKAKRKSTDPQKFKTMALWFTAAFIVILIMIPWPFSPLASRPWIRF